jgi:DNA helicase HerA-like ATPase
MPELYTGWLLDALPKLVEVNLQAKGLQAHTAIIGQSGSGKSFMLGRLLEEIASKTKARLLILDPNSDFGQFGMLTDGTTRFQGDDTREEFKCRWDRVGFSTLTQRPAQRFPEALRSSVDRISLGWHDLSETTKANCLGISLATHPEEYGVYQLTHRVLARAEAGTATLEKWLEETEKTAGSYPTMSGGSSRGQSYRNLASRLAKLKGFAIWKHGGGSVGVRMAGLFDATTATRVVCLDLGSLDEPEERCITAGVALEALWARARHSWTDALSASPDEDRRCPVFVVIDEAHNIAPEHLTSEAARPAVDTLVRIAMEGRKYGLFLILVTQRPARVNSSLLSQCDNLCLMRMSNPSDVRLVEECFGFIPRGWAEQALRFEKRQGKAILCGEFVERPVFVKGAPRRTVEGGRDLRTEAWFIDPVKTAADNQAKTEGPQDKPAN